MSRKRKTAERADGIIATLPPVVVPTLEPPTAEEIARRTALAEEARKLREEIGPLGFSAVDLIREGRDETDELRS